MKTALFNNLFLKTNSCFTRRVATILAKIKKQMPFSSTNAV
ncbi:hypothetical protein D931_03682 [Enterococcus faecium 13.SD.W.09]|nr:hypothetical protein D931_03682 [Enterococcus faecium 13.SD.W.09]